MDENQVVVPVVSRAAFAAAYEVAERAVLKDATLSPDLEETLRPALRIARAIARGLAVDADELYATSVRICALWRLLSTEQPEMNGLEIRFGEKGIECAPRTKDALDEAAASVQVSDDLRFDPAQFWSTVQDCLLPAGRVGGR